MVDEQQLAHEKKRLENAEQALSARQQQIDALQRNLGDLLKVAAMIPDGDEEKERNQVEMDKIQSQIDALANEQKIFRLQQKQAQTAIEKLEAGEELYAEGANYNETKQDPVVAAPLKQPQIDMSIPKAQVVEPEAPVQVAQQEAAPAEVVEDVIAEEVEPEEEAAPEVEEESEVAATPEVEEELEVAAASEVEEAPEVAAAPEVEEEPEVAAAPFVDADPAPVAAPNPAIASLNEMMTGFTKEFSQSLQAYVAEPGDESAKQVMNNLIDFFPKFSDVLDAYDTDKNHHVIEEAHTVINSFVLDCQAYKEGIDSGFASSANFLDFFEKRIGQFQQRIAPLRDMMK